MKLLQYGGVLLALFIGVRTVAPLIQEWNWKQAAEADRMESARALQPGIGPVTVEMIIAIPNGILQAASTCGDAALESRATRMLLELGNKLQPDKPSYVAAQVDADVSRAHHVDPRIEAILQKDCPRTLELARASIVNFEK